MVKSLNKKTLIKEKTEPKEEKILTCLICNEEGKQSKFYKSRSVMIADNFSLCKKCVKKIIAEDKKNNNIDNMLWMFRIMDFPFFQELWEECMYENDSLELYMKKCSAPNGKLYHMKYKDGLDINVIGASFSDRETNLGRWGSGFNDSECQKMNRIVDDYIKLTGKEDFKSIKDFERVARLEVTVDRVYASPNSKPNEIKQAEETLTSIMKEAGLTSDKMSSTNKASSLGEWIDIFEIYDPISEPAEEFKDVDKMGYYIERFFYKNLMRASGKDNSKVSDEFEEITKELKEKEKKFGG